MAILNILICAESSGNEYTKHTIICPLPSGNTADLKVDLLVLIKSLSICKSGHIIYRIPF